MSEQEQNKVAMVIVAHPDDAEFAGAGTIALWVREGWDVYYVICTDGGSGGPDDATDVSAAARQRMIETREKEQRAAGAVLGIKDVFFLGYPDGQLQPNLELRRDLVRLLRRYRPSRVLCQSPDRTWTPSLSLGRHHTDHLTAGRATLDAIYPAAQNPWDFPELFTEEGLKPHKISEVYIAGAPVMNYAVDITSTMELKFASLRAHTSQLEEHFADVEKWIRSMNAEAGKRHGVDYAEEFHRIETR
ncbi:MAG: PIG-L family deacetylase [Chloroflexi bacterium]|nr:PIG-L family deacetylase [Chloroflexota bacterium]